jgi:hypothetical protein
VRIYPNSKNKIVDILSKLGSKGTRLMLISRVALGKVKVWLLVPRYICGKILRQFDLDHRTTRRSRWI